MKKRIIQFIPLTLALLAVAFGYFSQWCIAPDRFCYGTPLEANFLSIISPLYVFALFSLPICILVGFVSRSVFNSWLKLLAPMLLVAFLYVVSTPTNWTGIGLDMFPFFRDDAARVSSEALTLISISLIIWKYFSSRQKHVKNI